MTTKLSKIELIKECQRLMLMNDYSVYSTKVIGEFMKENLETGSEYYQKHKEEFDKIQKETFDKLPQETKDKLNSAKLE